MKFLLACVMVASTAFGATKIDFWNTQHKGTNFFNQVETVDRLKASKQKGIQFVRLAPDKWKAAQRDFLLGNADEFHAIPKDDFAQLKKTLDEAAAAGVKVILTPLSLPGGRWRQHNGDRSDLRLWKDKKYHAQSAAFWKELATLLKGHPAIAAYDLYNEPHPEILTGNTNFWTLDFPKWYKSVQGTAADLNLFYEAVITAIRSVDTATPIVVETGLWATPWAISYLRPVKDDKVLYSIHMYEPYEYTNKPENKGRFKYPGKIDNKQWNKKTVEEFFAPVVRWQKENGISSDRILVGEFGVNRTLPGAPEYLSDVIAVLNKNNWHWAFYSFREDTWTGMDYELGSRPLGEKYWKAVEKGETPGLKRGDNALTQVLFKEFANQPPQ